MFVNAGSIGLGFMAKPSTDTSDAIFSNTKYNDKNSKIIRNNSNDSPKHDGEKVPCIGHVPFFGYLRASVGAGVSLALSPALTLEVTYSIPILKSSHDVTKHFQLGVGMSLS